MYQDFVVDTLQQSSQIAQSLFEKVSVSIKSADGRQVLTEADIAVGQHIVKCIRDRYPDHSVLDEEAGYIEQHSEYCWVVDPIEATSNFAVGLWDYGIMLGLLHSGQPIAGGVIAPAYGRLYYAERGSGATCNGQPISVSEEQDLSQALVSFSTDGYPDNAPKTYREMQLMADVLCASRNIRSSNCEATDMMYVAEGRYGGRINMKSMIWDNVAPQIIIEEAGGVYTLIDGSPLEYDDPGSRTAQNYSVCVGPPVLHTALLAIVKDQQTEKAARSSVI